MTIDDDDRTVDDWFDAGYDPGDPTIGDDDDWPRIDTDWPGDDD